MISIHYSVNSSIYLFLFISTHHVSVVSFLYLCLILFLPVSHLKPPFPFLHLPACLSIFFLSLIPLNLNLHSSIFFSSHLVTHHLKYHHKLRFVFPPLSLFLFLSWHTAFLPLSVYPNRLSVFIISFLH